MHCFQPLPRYPHALLTFHAQAGGESEEIMVELGERMLLVAILGTMPVLGAFISITAAYHIKLGSVSKQLGCAAAPCRCPSRPPARPPSSSPPLWCPRAAHGARQAPPTTTIWSVAYQRVTLAVYHPMRVVVGCVSP